MQKLISFDSGSKLVHVYDPTVRSVAIGVFVGAGVIRESEKLAGISHFIEHMVFKGTSTRSGFDIVNDIDSIGAQINAYTAKSYTCFHTVSLDSNADKCAEILADLYFDPAFDSEELEKERKVVIEEINESEDTPDDVCLDRLLTAFFKGHPLEKPILGTKKTLAAMTSDTLREYHKRTYVPENTVVSIAGNISEEDAVALMKRHFESRMKPSGTRFEEVAHATINGVLTRKKKHIEQAHLAFAFPCYAFADPRMISVQLMSVIFGTEMSSRLFQSVREKLGLCYTVLGYPSSYKNNGAYIIYTATNPGSVEKAVRAIRGEIDLLLKDGVTLQELKKGKEQLKTALVLAQESTASMMRTFGSYCIETGELYDLDGRITKIDAMTASDILDAARHIFDFDKAAASIVAQNDGIDILKIMKNA